MPRMKDDKQLLAGTIKHHPKFIEPGEFSTNLSSHGAVVGLLSFEPFA